MNYKFLIFLCPLWGKGSKYIRTQSYEYHKWVFDGLKITLEIGHMGALIVTCRRTFRQNMMTNISYWRTINVRINRRIFLVNDERNCLITIWIHVTVVRSSHDRILLCFHFVTNKQKVLHCLIGCFRYRRVL